ncbi:MAG: hypothetical protein ACTSR8_18055 [Promethearchaeota archaeon]
MNSIDTSREDTGYLIKQFKTDSIHKKELKDNLVIFYFDQKIGPSVLYSYNMEMLEDFELSRFLDVLDYGTFIFALKDYQTINHISYINHDLARGREIPFMISYMINNVEIEESYRYLESKTIVLESFANELRELDGIGDIFNQRTRLNEVLHENQFLKIFKKFYKRLSLKFRILKPFNELKTSKIDVYNIKLHLIPNDLTQILNTILRGEQLVIHFNKDMEFEKKFCDFMCFIFYDSFKASINTKQKKFLKNHNTIHLPNKLKIEFNPFIKKFVKQFYFEKNDILALLNLRDKIRELYVLTRSIVEYTRDSSGNQFLHRKSVIKDLEKLFYIKIKRDYFYLLSQIVESYFKTEIYWIHDFVAEKIEEMWR